MSHFHKFLNSASTLALFLLLFPLLRTYSAPNPPDTGKPILTGGQVVEAHFTTPRAGAAAQVGTSTLPTITLWYGDHQHFGQVGNPQKWLNILGNVVSSNPPLTLTWSLNGAPAKRLALGADTRRLADPGDFNVELDYTQLISGDHHLLLSAIDSLGQVATRTVTVTYTSSQTWPLPYVADWATAPDIQSVAQVVDGHWAIVNGQLHAQQFDYDRLVALGDVTWKDYEVTMPVTIHAIDESGFAYPSNGPGLGFLFRWQGHYVEVAEQPGTGWKNLGALGWTRWARDGGGNVTNGLELLGYKGRLIAANASKTISFDVPYIFKMNVQSSAGQPSYYRLKTWPAANSEPAAWDVEGRGRAGELAAGSLLLVVHHVDASIGAVTVQPVSTPVATPTPTATVAPLTTATPAQTATPTATIAPTVVPTGNSLYLPLVQK